MQTTLFPARSICLILRKRNYRGNLPAMRNQYRILYNSRNLVLNIVGILYLQRRHRFQRRRHRVLVLWWNRAYFRKRNRTHLVQFRVNVSFHYDTISRIFATVFYCMNNFLVCKQCVSVRTYALHFKLVHNER